MRRAPVNVQELSVGIDIGGTFTDAVLYDKHKRVLQWVKVPSTPNDPEQGLLNAVEGFTGIDLKQITRIVHGITIGTNAVIERQVPETLKPRQIQIARAPKAIEKDVVDANTVN